MLMLFTDIILTWSHTGMIAENSNKLLFSCCCFFCRNFYDILNCTTQFDYFKRFLIKEKAETPLLFWAAVESMRTMSKSGKARQGRAHGIVKRYFGPSAEYGKSTVYYRLLILSYLKDPVISGTFIFHYTST